MNSARQHQLARRLQEIAQDLSGYSVEDLKPSRSFLELGFDSLLVTQLSTAYQKEFGIPITFRQLFDQYPSIDALSVFIDEHLPEELSCKQLETTEETGQPAGQEPGTTRTAGADGSAVSPEAASSLPSGIAGPNAIRLRAGVNGLEAILIQQLELMTEQLRILERLPAVSGDRAIEKNVPSHLIESEEKAGAIGTAAAMPVDKEPARTVVFSGFGPGSVPANVSGQELPSKQQEHLDWLIREYTKKTAGSKARTQRHRKALADPRTAAGFNRRWKEMVYPIWVERSRGSKLWDVDGNEYIDLLNGFGPNLFGHSAEFIAAAVERQLRQGFEVGPQTLLAGEAAEMICQLTGMDRVSFVCTGSEAVQAAMRLARTVTGRDKVVLFTRDYHGNFDQVLVREANRDGKLRTIPSAPGIPYQSVADTYVLEYGTEESLDTIRRQAGEVAAVLVEPIQSRRPEFRPKEFLHALRALTREKGIVLIFDEVVTGFRIAPGGAQEYFGIEADLATYGKVVAGGMPIGVVAGREAIMNAFDGGFWQYGDDSFPSAGVTFFAGTFVRHPLAIAAAHASLTHMIKEGPDLQRRVSQKADGFARRVNRVFKDHQANLELAQFSSIMYLRNHEEAELAGLFHYHLRYRGVHIQEGFPSYMTDAHTEADIESLLGSFESSVEAMAEAGIFGRRKGTGSGPAKRCAGGRDLAEQARDAGQAVSLPTVPPAQFDSTPLQREMWLAAQMSPQASASNNGCIVVEIEGPLDLRLLERAVRQVVEGHEALRAAFSEDGKQVIVDSRLSADIRMHDLSAKEAAERGIEVERILADDGRKVFDLRAGPLAVFRIIKLTPTRHLLTFTVQMIVCDGWGFKVVLEEVSERYHALKENRQPSIGTIRQMREYSAWRRTAEGLQSAKESEDFWLSKFDTLPPPFDLKTAQLRPPVRRFEAGRVSLRLSSELCGRMKKSVRELQSTPVSLLLTSFGVWLSRLTVLDDIVINVPYAAQGALGLERFTGQCVHALPFRFRIDEGESFRNLVKKTRDLLLDGGEAWNVTLGSIVSKLGLPNDPSRMPLANVMFNLDPALNGVRFPGCETRISSGPRFYFPYDLGFNAVDEGETLLIECDYNTNLMDAASVEGWLDCFKRLLEAELESPDRPVRSIPLLDTCAGEERVLTCGTASVEMPQGMGLASKIARCAGQSTESIVIERGELQITYQEVFERATRLSESLVRNGAGPGGTVAIHADNGEDLAIAALAVLKIGAALVITEPKWNNERIGLSVRNSEACLLLTTGELAGRCQQFSPVPLIDVRSGAELEGFTGKKVIRKVNEAGGGPFLCFPQPTEGGIPRVALDQQAVHQKLRRVADLCSITSKNTILAFGPSSSARGLEEALLGLVTGARVVFAATEKTVTEEIIAGLIQDHSAPIVIAPRPLWALLARVDGEAKFARVICVGDEPPHLVPRKLLNRFKDVWYWYSKADFGGLVLISRIEKDSQYRSLEPIPGIPIRLVDGQEQALPAGVKGWIAPGGRMVGSGWGGQTGATLLGGDIASRRPDGKFVIHGSRNRQFRSGGHEIHPEDIESLLLEHPLVEDAHVGPSTTTAIGTSPAAYLACGTLTEQERFRVRQEAQEAWERALPAYMRPAAVAVIDEIPRNSSGVVECRMLPPVAAANLNQGTAMRIAPKNTIEAKIARLWTEVLQIEPVSVTANFFDLGGQSLHAVSLFTKIEQEFGVKLPLAILLKHPTVEQLAKALENGEQQVTWSSLVPIQPEGDRPPLFLVHGAGGNVLLFRTLAEKLSPDYPVYGLQSKGLDGKSEPLHSIEDMAANYLREVRTVRPHGPYYLGGYCLGGTIAYEMAQRLQEEGETVALLAMLDTYNYSRALRVRFSSFIAQKIRFHLANLSELRLVHLVKYLKEKARQALSGELVNLRSSVPRGMDESTGRATCGVELSIQAINDQAAENYVPRPYPGNVTIIKPRVNYKFYPDPDMGFGDLIVGHIDMIEVGTNPHAMLLEPHVEILAREIKRRIEESLGIPSTGPGIKAGIATASHGAGAADSLMVSGT